jgi:hypothetical protein
MLATALRLNHGIVLLLVQIARRLYAFHSDFFISIGGVAVAVGLLALLYVGYAPLRIFVVVTCLVVAPLALVMVFVKQDDESEEGKRGR